MFDFASRSIRDFLTECAQCWDPSGGNDLLLSNTCGCFWDDASEMSTNDGRCPRYYRNHGWLSQLGVDGDNMMAVDHET
jgi:hypothetical protein